MVHKTRKEESSAGLHEIRRGKGGTARMKGKKKLEETREILRESKSLYAGNLNERSIREKLVTF